MENSPAEHLRGKKPKSVNCWNYSSETFSSHSGTRLEGRGFLSLEGFCPQCEGSCGLCQDWNISPSGLECLLNVSFKILVYDSLIDTFVPGLVWDYAFPGVTIPSYCGVVWQKNGHLSPWPHTCAWANILTKWLFSFCTKPKHRTPWSFSLLFVFTK